jgi:hypothetical protein
MLEALKADAAEVSASLVSATTALEAARAECFKAMAAATEGEVRTALCNEFASITALAVIGRHPMLRLAVCHFVRPVRARRQRLCPRRRSLCRRCRVGTRCRSFSASCPGAPRRRMRRRRWRRPRSRWRPRVRAQERPVSMIGASPPPKKQSIYSTVCACVSVF